MPGLLDPYANNKLGTSGPAGKSITSPAGTVYINNTSYSGVDIKVVAHIYDPNNAALLQYRALDNESKQAQIIMDEARGELAKLRKKLETIHVGTPEEERIKNQIDGQLDKIRALDSGLDSIKTKISQTELSIVTGAVLPLGTLQTLSISTNRDKRDVRAIGHVGPKGRTRGPRSIAGSMVFTVMDRHPFYDFMRMHASEFDGVKYTPALADQMPPVDLTIVFANEYGHLSRMAILGVDFATDGKVMSIQDILTEETLSYFAYDIDPMRSVAQRRIDENYHLMNEWVGVRGSSLMMEEDYRQAVDDTNPFIRFLNRTNPYV